MADEQSLRTRTLILVCLASILEKADEALLPAVYEEVGDELRVSPSALGSLTLYRSLVQAACYPLVTYFAARYNRAHVIAAGAILWAVPTFLVGISRTFVEVAISRGLNGIGLALAIPAISSLVADLTDNTSRGTAFGWLQMMINMGSIVGGFFGVMLAPITILGIPGWRFAFLIVAVISFIIGIFVLSFGVDPHFKNATRPYNKTVREELKDLIEQAKQVVKIRSFVVIVAQGITGTIPWSALQFGTLWLELTGFTHFESGVIMGLYLFAVALGSLFGGYLGDPVARRYPNTGRILLAQISSFLAIPLGAVLLLGLPIDSSTFAAHALVFTIMGFGIAWNASSTNNPIFAEIVQEKARTTVYALDKSFEAVFASFAYPVVGILAERIFGYKPVPSEYSVDVDRENAAALAKAMYALVAAPMALCCITYSFLYCTYPEDRERARVESLNSPEHEPREDGEHADSRQRLLIA